MFKELVAQWRCWRLKMVTDGIKRIKATMEAETLKGNMKDEVWLEEAEKWLENAYERKRRLERKLGLV